MDWHVAIRAGSSDVYSQFIFAALLSHPGGAFHIKLFYALFVSVALRSSFSSLTNPR